MSEILILHQIVVCMELKCANLLMHHGRHKNVAGFFLAGLIIGRKVADVAAFRLLINISLSFDSVSGFPDEIHIYYG